MVAVARNAVLLASLRHELGGTLTTEAADVADAVVAGTLIEQYQPDTLVLNAGAAPLRRPLQHHTWESSSRNWEVDARHAFHGLGNAMVDETLRRGGGIHTLAGGGRVAWFKDPDGNTFALEQ